MTRNLLLVAILALAPVLVGCGEDGPARHRVSGSVTLDGVPIPHGEVVFSPDAAKKNSGPQGIAPIKDGKFDTAATGGMGVGGGPTVARVNGMTGPGGKTLCEFEIQLDLPKADSTQELKVPKEGKSKQGGKSSDI